VGGWKTKDSEQKINNETVTTSYSLAQLSWEIFSCHKNILAHRLTNTAVFSVDKDYYVMSRLIVAEVSPVDG
jgi:hypothetical protein